MNDEKNPLEADRNIQRATIEAKDREIAAQKSEIEHLK